MRTLILIFILALGLHAKLIEANYKVTYGLLGTIVEAKVTINSDDENYCIILEAEAVGLAKTLSGGRKEYYESSGRIENGLFLTDNYTVVKKRKTKTTTSRHTIKNGEIKVKKFVEEKGDVRVSEEILDYKAKFDYLSLYGNVIYRLENEKKNRWDIKTIGGKADDKKVTITRLVDAELNKMKKYLKIETAHYLFINVHQKIFSSKEGILNVAMDKDGIIQKAVLKDVIFFGDITGTLVGKTVR